MSADEMHRYWRNPTNGNLPQDYLAPSTEPRSIFLVQTIARLADTDARILEIGCNAGRNLDHLWRAGYRNLEAIEISEKAIETLKQAFPELGSGIHINIGTVEQVITTLDTDCFDIVFTMAVLEHLHTSSEWVFPEIVRITSSKLLTIEDEYGRGSRHVARNYRRTFEPLGMVQLESKRLNMSEHALGSGFVARIFEKRIVI
jgi:SAM-dependent methyltransferase